ncbi:MAG: VOC family protein [Longimicrobiales bacterium]
MAEDSPFAWHELVTTDPVTSGTFFGQLFGWTRKEVEAGPRGTYTVFQDRGQDVAGMMSLTGDPGGRGSELHTYIAVDDVDESALRATSLGGRVVVQPHTIPEVGRVCVVSDPTGAMLRLIRRPGR